MDPRTVPTSDEIDTTTRPTSREMRAPASTREKMSRPSSSSPNQCVAEGPSRRWANSCAAGSKRANAGPSNAATIATSTIAPPSLLIADPRIDEAVQQVRDEVHADVRHCDEQDASLDERVIAEPNRLNEKPADPGPREDRLGDDRARQHRTELQADERDHWNQAVSERVPYDRAHLRDTAGTGGGHVLFAQLLEQCRPRHPGKDGGQRRAERHRRQHEVGPRATPGDRQPAKLDRENDCQQRSQPEVGNRNTQKRQRRGPVVDRCAPP